MKYSYFLTGLKVRVRFGVVCDRPEGVNNGRECWERKGGHSF